MTKLLRDFSAQILDLKGKPVPGNATTEALSKALDLALAKVPEAEREGLTNAINIIVGEPMTLGGAVAHALTTPTPGENGMAIGESSKRLSLALKLIDGGMVEITPEERDLMKERVSKVYLGALVPGRIAELLETDAKPALKEAAD